MMDVGKMLYAYQTDMALRDKALIMTLEDTGIWEVEDIHQ